MEDELEEGIIDMIAILLHLAEAIGSDTDEIINLAKHHFEEENHG